MRKWAVPLTVLGIGGIGAFFISDRGRNAFRWVVDRVSEAPGKVADWNETAQKELDRIQNTLNQIAETLQAPPLASRK